MRKHIARALVVAAAFSSLVVAGPAPTVSAHHQPPHHCSTNPTEKNAQFKRAIRKMIKARNKLSGKENRDERKAVSRAIRAMRHTTHRCVYPPS